MTEEDDTNNTFEFLSRHMVEGSFHVTEMSQRTKDRLLTILSFCLIGILTFAAAYTTRDQTPQGYEVVVTLLGISLVIWLISFAITILANPTHGALLVPGEAEKITFLPILQEKSEFRKDRRYEPFDADVFFSIKAILRLNGERLTERDRMKYEDFLTRLAAKDSLKRNEYVSLIDTYYGCIRIDNSLATFNKNAWLATLVHFHQSRLKQYDQEQKRFRLVRVLFVISMSLFMAAFGVSLFYK